jgi:hypothetical protein
VGTCSGSGHAPHCNPCAGAQCGARGGVGVCSRYRGRHMEVGGEYGGSCSPGHQCRIVPGGSPVYPVFGRPADGAKHIGESRAVLMPMKIHVHVHGATQADAENSRHGPSLFDQVEVRRSYRGAIVSGISAGSVLAPVSLAPSLVTRGLPPIVDVVHTVWSRNPFGALPAGEVGLGGVLEYTLRNAASGAEVPLPGTASSSDGPPMRFLVAIGAY